ncbi:MAG TPA: hypothetical protein VFV10_03115 [Gammaproteobacteria bacterium]|nr:hypothetical protein [Gammaproteobacteria bacterium]
MKYFLATLAGIAAGAVLAAVCLYYNPLTTRAAAALEEPSATLQYALPEGDLIATTHSRRLPFSLEPPGIDSLWERTVRSAALSVLSLHAADGGLALATRLTRPSEATDLLLRGAILDDYWLVTMPGAGSLFVHDLNNVWPALRENGVRVSLLGRSWRGPSDYATTVGPEAPRGPGLVLGGTGRFAGVVGEAAERYRLSRYSRARGAEQLTGELLLDLPAAAAPAQPAETEAPAAPGPATADTRPQADPAASAGVADAAASAGPRPR